MHTVSITELKARLSAFLDVVRQGDDVVITDRGRPIAKLTPMQGADGEASRRELLLRSGVLRGPEAPLASDFLARRRPRDGSGASLAALLAERTDAP